ncbi:hypothetical protein Syun_015207 [Stephania yunnanensis]|uniref:Transcription factor MYC/MYB N-terminal domain-containing protein n=1 Tax=Stephania yunnanensis TaxID=152371 RepID=A0AAP0P9H6_9MAGN
MENGFPMLNCLLQHTLKTLCSSSPDDSPKWVYAVFWRILPRNYPPPKWDYGGSFLDRSKGNKRNWILVWEDGYCDFIECERAGSGYIKGRFGADVFFKMSHEVYSFGEGLVGKVAADSSHKWVFRQNQSEKDLNLFTSWNGSIDPQPKAWETQFNSGIQTISIISVREGLLQLGSLEKVVEDLNLVMNIQRKFSYLQSIPGVLSMQRPYLSSTQYPNTVKPNSSTTPAQMININETSFLIDDKRHLLGSKRCYGERLVEDQLPNKSLNLGWNTPVSAGGLVGGGVGQFWSLSPQFPAAMSCSLGALLSKLPSVIPPLHDSIEGPETALEMNNSGGSGSSNSASVRSQININDGGLEQISLVKSEPNCLVETSKEEKHKTQISNSSLEPN